MKYLLTTILIISTTTLAAYHDIPPVIISDEKIVINITGESAKQVFEALKGEESSGAGHTFRFGPNIACNEYHHEYFCSMPYDQQGKALNPQDEF